MDHYNVNASIFIYLKFSLYLSKNFSCMPVVNKCLPPLRKSAQDNMSLFGSPYDYDVEISIFISPAYISYQE